VTTKQKVLEAVRSLPDNATVEDAMQRLLLLAKIERGIQQADAGQILTHGQVKEKMAKWLK
jgi:predicted transcriptional regulator